MATERFHPHFADDLAGACKRYDSISESLGLRCRSSVNRALNSIAERPESFGKIGGDFRGAMHHRFPYVVVFEIDPVWLTFFGLRHAASDRGDWFGRKADGIGEECSRDGQVRKRRLPEASHKSQGNQPRSLAPSRIAG